MNSGVDAAVVTAGMQFLESAAARRRCGAVAGDKGSSMPDNIGSPGPMGLQGWRAGAPQQNAGVHACPTAQGGLQAVLANQRCRPVSSGSSVDVAMTLTGRPFKRFQT
jgi:hypothetical protein